MISKRERNIQEKKADLMAAVRKVIIEQGFYNLNLSTIGEELKSDKTAIYRYYGGLPELLATYIEEQKYWLNSLRDFAEKDDIEDKEQLLKDIVEEQFEVLYKHPDFQQLLAWELADKTDLTASVTIQRERFTRRLLELGKVVALPDSINLNYILALIFGGFYYVIMHKHRGHFCTVDLEKTEDKAEFKRTIYWLIDLVLSRAKEQSRDRLLAIRLHRKGMENGEIAGLLGIDTVQVQCYLEDSQQKNGSSIVEE
ncbi:MAG: TetR/AcrR family transcriptional regulator [Mangrovibacterium sp.]